MGPVLKVITGLGPNITKKLIAVCKVVVCKIRAYRIWCAFMDNPECSLKFKEMPLGHISWQLIFFHLYATKGAYWVLALGTCIPVSILYCAKDGGD